MNSKAVINPISMMIMVVRFKIQAISQNKITLYNFNDMLGVYFKLFTYINPKTCVVVDIVFG